MELTKEQTVLLEVLDKWLHKPYMSFMVEGRAGTGKTTAISEFAKKINRRVIGCAITNKATSVLQDKSEIKCKTIASLCYLKIEVNEDSEILSLKATRPLNDIILGIKQLIGDNGIIIIDEASMIPKDLFKLLKQLPFKKIFLGDRYQLPPINEKLSETFEIEHRFILKDNIRSGDNNPLIKLFNSLISCQHKNELLLPQAILKEYKTKANLGWVVNDSDSMWSDYPFITYHNDKKKEYNIILRNKLRVSSQYDWVEQDKIVFNQTYPLEYGAKLYNGEVYTINKMQNYSSKDIAYYWSDNPNDPPKAIYPYANLNTSFYNFYMVKLDNYNEILSIPSRSAKTAIRNVANEIKNRILKGLDGLNWKHYYAYLNRYYDCDYGYAITSHKSQGSTYDYVTVDANDILSSKMSLVDKIKALYVACSRARYMVNLLIDDKYIKGTSTVIPEENIILQSEIT